MGELAKSITTEQGKTLADAEGDVLRGLRKYIDIKYFPMESNQSNLQRLWSICAV